MKSLFLCICLSLSVAYAGPGHGQKHSHGHSHSHKKRVNVTEKETKEIGKHHIDRLVKAGKIDKSWENAKYDLSLKKKFGKRLEWVVTYTNDKGKKGKKLFIFLRLSGKFVAANFTGK